MAGEIVVLKFGSSVLRGRGDLPAATHEIYRWYRAGHRVIAVVSAIGDTTELLLAEARELDANAEPHALAELLATGERHAAALLGVALERAGVPARVLCPRDVQLFASGSALDSEPISVNGEKIRALLDATPVLVLPGFFGHDVGGRLHLLGRGGSDLTAVFLSTSLRAQRCRLIKDVDGVYESDPALASGERPRRFAKLSYADALERAAPLIQPKAVQLLQRFGRDAEIAALGEPHASVVNAHAAAFDLPVKKPPSNVVLLGLGTVGFGVYQRLAALPKHFRVVGILIRNPTKHLANGVPAGLLHTRHQSLSELEPDIVVDALSDDNLSVTLARLYLAYGIPVISASKSLIADAGLSLQQLAREQHTSLHYSAAVGGSTPMLEAVERARAAGEIRALCGVLNGTCNFVLERCSAGVSFATALREAQSLGLAEADPTEDLSGRDSARKLVILARHAFGEELRDIEMEPITEEEVVGNLAHRPPRSSLHLVCRAWREGARLFGRVQIEALDAAHPLGAPRGDWNALQISQTDGPGITVSGRGAGRWPTTEAIVADLLAQRFGRATHSAERGEVAYAR
jgi:homoserine dehydrogenase